MRRRSPLLLAWAMLLMVTPARATPIHDAVKAGSSEQVSQLLEADKGVVGQLDDKGMTPLHLAAAAGQLDIALLLLNAGANVNAVTPQNWTPLLEATNQGQTEMVRLLLSRGARVDAREKQNRGTSLHIAAFQGNLAICRLLLQAGASVNARDGENLTPYFQARDQGFTEVMKLLKQAGGR